MSTPRIKVKKDRYAQYVREALAAKGQTLLFINWGKRSIHLLDEKNNKKVIRFFGI